MNKLVVAIQFYERDKPQAMRLARMIADIETKFRGDVEILFVARFDCEHDCETIDYVAKKFLVHWITTHTRWMGWPGGCNAMAKDTLEWVAANRKEALGLLMMEPDCVPVDIYWIDDICDEWKSLPNETLIMGAWRESGGADGHLNGNCIVQPALFSKFALPSFIGEHLAWDCQLAPFLKNFWHKTSLIQNCFDSRGAKEGWIDPNAVLVHGYKDDSCYQLAKERMGL